MSGVQPPEAQAHPSDAGQEINLLDYWRVLVQRRAIVFACIGVVVALTVVSNFLAVPEYEAVTTLHISRQAPQVTTFQDVLSFDPMAWQDFYPTQFKIIQSRSVIRLAAERMDLANRPELLERKGPPIGRAIAAVRSWLPGAAPRVEGTGDPLDPAIDFITGGLDVQPVRNSQLVRISFTDRDPQLATEVANQVASAYQQFNIESKHATTAQASEFLTKEVVRIQAEIAAAESKLQEYSSKKEILSVGGLKDISEQALADLNAKLTEARGRLALAQARYRSVTGVSPDGLPEVLNSPLIARLKEEHARLEREHSRMAERFKEDWPALQEVTEALVQSKTRLRIESESIASQVRQGAKADFDRARAEVTSLQDQVDSQKAEVQRFNRDNIQFASLKSEIETKRKVLNDLVTRQSETQTSERLKDTQTSNIRIVDLAETPQFPVRPRKLMNLLLALFLGTGLGIAAAFLADHLDSTVKDENDVRRFSGMPVLGHVPLHQPLRAVGAGDDGSNPLDAVDAASHLDPKSIFAESFKNIRTSFLLASPERPPRTVVVTSFEPGDGKSTVCLNLAIVLAQMGRRILLIDADLRRPRLHRMLHLDNAQGLSSILSGNASIDGCIQETEIPGLRAISSGPIPPNPSELLGSASLPAFVERVAREGSFDHVFFDSPPSLQVADGVILSSILDATIIVVRGGKTSRSSLTQGAERMRAGRGHMTGAVLNAVSSGAGYYYYHYGKYGHYRHGDEDAAAGASGGRSRRSWRSRRAGRA